MAIYHCNVKTHSRTHDSANHAVRSAAYRAGAILVDEASGNKYNYSRKSEVTYSEIMVPANAPDWASNRTLLWNNVEKSEKRVDAVLFREIEVALPIELTQDEWIEIIREYVLKTMTTYGIIVDYSIHDKDGNPHCHMMLTLRDISELGFGNKNRDWNDKKLLYKWRQEWEKITNAHLAKSGINETIDCRSLKAQGVDRLPTAHEGREGIGGHNTAIVNQRRQRNRRIRADNSVRSELKLEKKRAVKTDADLETINAEILELSKSINTEPLASTAMTIYHAPKPKIGTIPGIDDKLKLNLPPKPIEAARCYALRALFGKDIDTQFNKRLAAMQNIGGNYSWEAFYIELQEGSNQTHGADLTWWRCYTNMVFTKHKTKLYDISKLVPEYSDHLSAYAMELQAGRTNVNTSIPTVNTSGLTSKPTVASAPHVQPSTKPSINSNPPEAPVQFTYKYKGKNYDIRTYIEFKNLVKNETEKQQEELHKDYWKSISLAVYSKRVYWAGSQHKKKLSQKDFDPIDLINYHAQGMEPRIFVEHTVQYGKNNIPTPDVVTAIFTGNSKMCDYSELENYAIGRKLPQGQFDRILVPWWNQFNSLDYRIEVARIAASFKLSLKLDKTSIKLIEQSFESKVLPSEFVRRLRLGTGTGTGSVAPGVNHNINGNKPKPLAPSPTPYASPSPYSSKKGGGDTPGSW